MPIGEQLGQVKEAAKGKVGEFVNQANVNFEQAKNDPSNKASDEKLKQDVDTTAKDAASSYNTAVDQVTNVVNSVKGAFTSTKNSGTTNATSAPNVSDSAPAQPAQSVTQSIGQTAAVITDAVKNTFAPRQTVPGTQPGLNNLNTDQPQDVPRKAPE